MNATTTRLPLDLGSSSSRRAAGVVTTTTTKKKHHHQPQRPKLSSATTRGARGPVAVARSSSSDSSSASGSSSIMRRSTARAAALAAAAAASLTGAVVAPGAASAAASAAAAATATAAPAAAAGLLFIPPWTPLNIALLALASLNLLAGLSEGKGQNTPYSKFSPTNKEAPSSSPPPPSSVLSSRTGMAIIYAGGFLVSALAPFVLPASFGLPPGASLLSAEGRPFLVALLLAVHFLKREVEVFFLHRYSGGMPSSSALMISCVYTLTSLQYLFFTRMASEAGFYQAASSSAPASVAAVLGAALFLFGQGGNLYHHWLLARLRGEGQRRYAVPQGGLFSLVAAPHYLLEIVAWLGLAIATQTVVPLVSCAGMASYLAGRSAATRRWNRENLPGYPSERRRLVPFLW